MWAAKVIWLVFIGVPHYSTSPQAARMGQLQALQAGTPLVVRFKRLANLQQTTSLEDSHETQSGYFVLLPFAHFFCL